MTNIIDIIFTDRSNVKSKLRKLEFDNKEKFDLALNAFDILSKIKKSKLSVTSSIKSNKEIELYDHQIYAAIKVKNEFGGSAILADEVGLQSKFDLNFVKQRDDRRFKDPASHELLIMSHSSAVSPIQANLLKKRDWDMIIVDEAHSMKNSETHKHKLLKELPRKFTLFLTATPIENNLRELYNLVELIKPGTFGTLNEFKNRYTDDPQMRSINLFFKDELQQILSKIIIRTTRQQVKKYIKFTDRIPHTKILKPTDDERELYEKITKIIQEKYAEGYPVFYLMIIQRLTSSSTVAAKRALYLMKKREYVDETEYNELMKIANRIKIDTKAIELLDIVRQQKNAKFLIFVEWRSTQDYLAELLTKSGYSVTLFNGDMNLAERDESRERFRGEIQIMISTSAGGYGMNFQFCSNVVNYDLPWNPMKIEQRVGRVHRIGQKNDVNIYNVAYEKTIDAYILTLLYTKIQLFKMALGLYTKIQLFKMALGHLDLLFADEDGKTETGFFKEYISSKDEKEAEKKFSAIGENWKNRKENLSDAVEEFNRGVFDNFSLSPMEEKDGTD